MINAASICYEILTFFSKIQTPTEKNEIGIHNVTVMYEYTV